MTLKARKARMRREAIGRVGMLTPEARRDQELVLLDQLPRLPGFVEASLVLMHVSAFADEVDTGPMLRMVLSGGKRLACPRIDPVNRRLDLFEVENLERDLVPGFWDIREPSATCRPVGPLEVDWSLVPGVAFDSHGYRLGRGGGYYDRLLSNIRPDSTCWALIFAEQWVAEVPREPHDRPLNGVTDHRTTWAGARAGLVTGP